MKALTQVFQRPVWLDNTLKGTAPALKQRQPMLVLPKEHYSEFQRSYKAALTDLPKLIRNELKVLSAAGNKAIWKVQASDNGRYQVLFAVIPASTLALLAPGWCLLIPETWILYRLLSKRTLYKVQADAPYWAWLTDANVLHLTQIQGLMKNSAFFLDALGENSEGVTVETLSLKQKLQQQKLPLKWWELAGCVIQVAAPKTKADINYKKLAIFAGGFAAAYMAVLSAVLAWQESSLQASVQQLQAEASTLFDQQQALDKKADVIAQYYALYQRFPAAGIMLHQLSSQLTEDVVLENIQLSGPLMQIRGVSVSAINVLAKLTGDSTWREVKFDRNIQKVSSGESFTISLVFNDDKAGAGNEE